MKLKVKKKKVALKEAPMVQGRNLGNKKFQDLKDDYDPIVELVKEKSILVKQYKSKSGQEVKLYLKISVKRFDGDDGLGLPNVFLQVYQESERYTGYVKGKCAYFPLEMLYDVIDALTELSETCDRLKIEY